MPVFNEQSIAHTLRHFASFIFPFVFFFSFFFRKCCHNPETAPIRLFILLRAYGRHTKQGNALDPFLC